MPFADWPPLLLIAQQGADRWLPILTLWVPLIVIFWLLMIRPQRKQEQQRRAMIAAVKKNDRVLTAGGIYGVVTNVHREADEITIKVDEATNTKLRITPGSIARVLGEGVSDESSAK